MVELDVTFLPEFYGARQLHSIYINYRRLEEMIEKTFRNRMSVYQMKNNLVEFSFLMKMSL